MKKKLRQVNQNLRGHRRAFTLIALSLIATITLSTLAYNRLNDQSDRRFVADTRMVTNFIVNDIEGYNSVLYSARSYAINTSALSQSSWDNFIKSQRTFVNNPGLSTVFLVSVVSREGLPSYGESLRSNGLIDGEFAVKPTGDRAVYGFSTYVSSLDNLSQYRNFDIFSTVDRKLVYDTAAKDNRPTASKPFKLATGADGFFIALPITSQDHSVKRYVAASFHTNDFIASLYKGAKIDIATRVSDATDPKHITTLFSTDNWATSSNNLTRSDTIQFGGRVWRLEYRSGRSYDTETLTRRLAILIFLLGSTIIALLLIAHVRHLKIERGGSS